ncbi:hypothetical protein GKZ27_09890 [Enterorhabdus mucosicola]|uniref:Uncharacterized protein n=1 Tax=Adlercreutzia mucosicola TaxID=580026 RepID=A0A6N8JPM9_9ACTN|nr:hypothetical protein [Adlercreutzia mucosicola]MVX61755.1 hypothetical protein [Adlercreutzia mucosicola]
MAQTAGLVPFCVAKTRGLVPLRSKTAGREKLEKQPGEPNQSFVTEKSRFWHLDDGRSFVSLRAMACLWEKLWARGRLINIFEMPIGAVSVK